MDPTTRTLLIIAAWLLLISFIFACWEDLRSKLIDHEKRIEKRIESIDDAVDEWHKKEVSHMPLHEYLGWTWEEYKLFVEKGKLPPKREGSV